MTDYRVFIEIEFDLDSEHYGKLSEALLRRVADVVMDMPNATMSAHRELIEKPTACQMYIWEAVGDTTFKLKICTLGFEHEGPHNFEGVSK